MTARMSHAVRAARRNRIADELRAAQEDERRALMVTIARREHVSIEAVRRIRSSARIPMPSRAHAPSDRTLAILAELLRGERGVDIAGRVGVSRQRVDQVRAHAEAAGIVLP